MEWTQFSPLGRNGRLNAFLLREVFVFLLLVIKLEFSGPYKPIVKEQGRE